MLVSSWLGTTTASTVESVVSLTLSSLALSHQHRVVCLEYLAILDHKCIYFYVYFVVLCIFCDLSVVCFGFKRLLFLNHHHRFSPKMPLGYRMPARLRRKAGQTLNWIHPHSTPSPQRGRSFRFSAKRWTGYKNADQKYEHLKQKQPLRC